MGGSSQTTGFRYYMGLHFGLAHGPLNELAEVRVGGRTAWLGSQTVSGDIAVYTPYLFGGDKKEGGIAGTLSMMMGEATQLASPYLTSSQGAQQPTYRGLATAAFHLQGGGFTLGGVPFLFDAGGGLICSNNPYPKPWAFRLRRTTMGWDNNAPWYSAKALILLGSVKAMNPAHIIYEVLTNRDWGMGYPTGTLDDTGFRAAADQLYTEGLGLCLLWTRQDSIENFLQLIMNYVAGVLTTDRTTGLFTLTLIRGGYDITSLPSFNQDNIVELTRLDAGTLTGAVNEITVQWHDQISHTDQTVTVQSLGAIQAQGVVISDTRDYHGIPDYSLASRLAQRELRASSVPLKRIEVKLDRTAYKLKPGDPFKFSWPAEGLSNVVFRAAEVDYGLLTSGSIAVKALEDIFALPDSVYTIVQPTGWVVPNPNPTIPPNRQLMEATYRDLALNLSAADFAAIPAGAAFVEVMIGRPSGLSLNFELFSRTGSNPFVDVSTQDWTPTAVISASLQPFDTTIALLSQIQLASVAVGSAALISDGASSEIVQITALDIVALTATIVRGCVDTVPSAHAAGARIWFFDAHFAHDKTEWAAGESIDVKVATITSIGWLDITLAPDDNITLVGRIALPYPPAFLTIGGTRWDLVTTATGTVVLAWRERNRLTQNDQLVGNVAGTVTPEVGTKYNVRVFDNTTNTLLTSVLGLAATTWSFAIATNHTVRVEVQSVLGVNTSFQKQIAIFAYTALSDGLITEASVQLDTESSVDIFTG